LKNETSWAELYKRKNTQLRAMLEEARDEIHENGSLDMLSRIDRVLWKDGKE
jgi:hypothetical protein